MPFCLYPYIFPRSLPSLSTLPLYPPSLPSFFTLHLYPPSLIPLIPSPTLTHPSARNDALAQALLDLTEMSIIPESLVEETTQMRFQAMLTDFKQQGGCAGK